MNEKIKAFFIGAGSAIALFGTIILSRLFRFRRHGTDSNAGTRIENAGKTCESAKTTVEGIAGTTEQASRIEQDIERTNEQLTDSINTSKRILSKLKKRHPER